MIVEKVVKAPNDPRERIFIAGKAGELGIDNIDPKTHVVSRATIRFHRENTQRMLVEIDKIGNFESFFTSMKCVPSLVFE